MKHEINFDALTTNGEIVTNLTMKIEPFDIKCNKPMALQRLCVEYARLMGFKCSFAKIRHILRCCDVEIISALISLGVTGNYSMQHIACDRIAVEVDDEPFGIWDTDRKTFVD